MRIKPLLGALAAACLVAALGCFAMAWRSAGHRHLVPFAAPAAAEMPDTATGPLAGTDRAGWSGRHGPARRCRWRYRRSGCPPPWCPSVSTARDACRCLDPSVAGWYRPGTAPRGLGPTVLVGHVDSDHGPAVFYRLSGVRLGEKVQVVRADGSTSTYTIEKITVVSKTDFPSQAVFARTRRATIRLITCTGPLRHRHEQLWRLAHRLGSHDSVLARPLLPAYGDRLDDPEAAHRPARQPPGLELVGGQHARRSRRR